MSTLEQDQNICASRSTHTAHRVVACGLRWSRPRQAHAELDTQVSGARPQALVIQPTRGPICSLSDPMSHAVHAGDER